MNRGLLAALMRARTERLPCALATDLKNGRQALVFGNRIEGDRDLGEAVAEAARQALDQDRSGPIEGPEGRLFLHVFNPPLKLAIVGAVHVAQPLATMAALAGYEVTVIDPRRAFATEARFPGVTLSHDWPDEALARLAPDRRTAVVTLTHDPKLDDPALAVALRSPAFYVGALGSGRTHARRMARLREAGFDDVALARIHGPVGLALGARSPAEIAVSILAQVIQIRRQGAAGARAAA